MQCVVNAKKMSMNLINNIYNLNKKIKSWKNFSLNYKSNKYNLKKKKKF